MPARLEGAPNFRDLGGYPAAGGRVRPGRVFRSEALARLGDEDLRRLHALDIELVYDLRGSEERDKEPGGWPGAQPPETIAGLGLDSNDLAAVRISGWRHWILDPAFNDRGAREWMQHAYAEMPGLFARALASAFDRLAAPRPPVTLVHCTAGKDRTGFVCAMLLSALGVDRDAVFRDYLATGGRTPPQTLLENLLGDVAARLGRVKSGALLALATADPAYLETALARIDRDFGGVETYLERACGLSCEKRDRLRAHLLY